MMPPMFSSTPLSCVSLIYPYFVLRVLTPLKIRHPLNMLYVSGLISAHRVSSLPATANIILSLLGWSTKPTLTSTCLRSPSSLKPTSVIMKTLQLKHASTNVTLLHCFSKGHSYRNRYAWQSTPRSSFGQPYT